MAVGTLRRTVRAVFLSQLFIAVPVAGGAWWLQGAPGAWAALYGGACAIVMTVLLGRKIQKLDRRLKQHSEEEGNIGFAPVAVGFIPRFLFVLAAFAAGIGWLELLPMPLLVSYAAVHLAYLFSLRPVAARTKPSPPARDSDDGSNDKHGQ